MLQIMQTRNRSVAAALVPILILSISAEGFAKSTEDGVPFPMKYEGGSLPLNQHDKLTTIVGNSSVVFLQGKKRFEIPYASVTEVSYGSDVHRRVGQAIGVGVLTLGIGAMLLLVKTKKHYVGMTWLDKNKEDGAERKGGIVFKVGKGEYRGFMTALEGKTGLSAVNTDAKVGTGGTSKP
jgi:hypothetical protein